MLRTNSTKHHLILLVKTRSVRTLTCGNEFRYLSTSTILWIVTLSTPRLWEHRLKMIISVVNDFDAYQLYHDHIERGTCTTPGISWM